MTQIIDHLRLEELRGSLAHGEGIDQIDLDKLVEELSPLKEILRPYDKIERLPLFDRKGFRLGTNAPRWICHLLALRHRCAHVLLVWKSPALGEVFVLQVRDWSKDDSPGCIDISVGGHMVIGDSGNDEDNTAFDEMMEELKLERSDLDSSLEHIGGYTFDEENKDNHFYNSEWRDLYLGRIKRDGIGRIRFPDNEVAALFLITKIGAQRLLQQDHIPIASALRNSLPRFLGSYSV